MVLKVYVDFISQPSRAIVIFCRANGVEMEIQPVRIGKGEHLTPEFAAINPLRKLPVIDDDGFILPESHAILRYLACTKPGVPDHWYPSDSHQRARVDSILDWHHSNLRKGSAGTVFAEVIGPRFGRPVDPAVSRDAQMALRRALKEMEELWLSQGPFLGAMVSPTIADLSLACEFTMLELLPDSMREEFVKACPRVQAWAALVEKTLAPHFEEAHAIMRHVIVPRHKEEKEGATTGGAQGGTASVQQLTHKARI
eukprot:TRINITY_DN22288_c0_g1_i1.p1 TRINITY_DN22288_c0_g1~~TRINITY_DN22288_c0_g1_i1.p1  ORF type:complete len:255 (+),score=24.43 TRINITY_DN22288_c0_g1_i1:70-834(+)